MTEKKQKRMVLTWMRKRPYRVAYWNPQCDSMSRCHDWDEIYGKMSLEEIQRYISILTTILRSTVIFNDEEDAYWLFHTAKPSVKWKALIQMLEERQ